MPAGAGHVIVTGAFVTVSDTLADAPS